MAIYWPTRPGFKGRTLNLCVPPDGTCISASAAPHCGMGGGGVTAMDAERFGHQYRNDSRQPGTALVCRAVQGWRRVSASPPEDGREVWWHPLPPQWKLEPYLLRTQCLKVLPFKAWSRSVNMATHATLAARDFFLAKAYPSGPFTCIFSKTSAEFFLC